MPDSTIIQARGVAKRFGNFEAIATMDLEVGKGQCVGLLGPNGAGKSTFIGCLYGVVARSGGELSVFGMDPATQARDIKRRIGVVPQENALDDGLTVLENMRIYASFGGLSRKQADPRIHELLSYMALESKRDATIKTLSGGMKRRLTFVRALLADPELLILDEPTTGLDPSVRHLLWEKVIELREQGKTILVTTHYMHEAEVLCDHIIILDKGRVVGTGAPRELIERETPGFVGIFPAGTEELLKLHLQPSWELFHQGRQSCIRAPRFDDLLDLQRLSGQTALQLRPANLEDVYLKLTGSELSDDE
ncbi:ABC transporter ATP-binding protein [Luteolibacter sp. SL250]|uniref:ABC transporter ATP-binding protein n=1 Tax=Luteolibacter sp. SL250 TaxID=2995170 RepID=UPI0022704B27|nr:ABC transporter ATP-binding protein [Luteolibacter sp. SL250]WAC18289.1 ABC transporter ATP-binding protein [Luteolibacter sp. SL250]